MSLCLPGATIVKADIIRGEVKGGGVPIADSTVSLWAASSGAPKQLAEGKTDNQGCFQIRSGSAPPNTSMYLVARGGFREA